MKPFLVLLLLFLTSCGDDKFNRVEELKGFRILGVVATKSEVVPPDSSDLQLIVSDIGGGGRTISGTTKTCIDPGISLGAAVSCDHDPGTVNDTYDILFSDIALGVSNLYTGLAPDTVTVNIPATVFAGRSTIEQFNGVSYITIFEFTVDGKTETAFKRVTATNRGSINQPPSITDLLLNGTPIGVSKPNKNDKLQVTTAAPETYSFINVDGSQETKTEELQVAWYVSYGELNKPKAEAQEDVKYLSSPPGSQMVILSILRDDRGGVSIERAVSSP